MPIIEIESHHDGTLKIDGVGYRGKACEKSLFPIVKALGIDPSETNLEGKPELLEQTEITEDSV